METRAAQFDLGPGDIDAAIASADDLGPESLWQACRVQARVAVDELALEVESGYKLPLE
jgi:hypothetical protein